MARLFVTNDDETQRVELIEDTEGIISAWCSLCRADRTQRVAPLDDLLYDTRARFDMADAVAFAEIHVDRH